VGQQDNASSVATVREFNRFYTRVIGVLDEGLLDTPYTLTEARVIFELAQGEQVEVATLRRRLGLDPGYLSRILSRYESDGLIIRSRSTSDARRQVVRLTAAGRSAYKTLDERSARQIQAVLEGLADEEQRRLLAAMSTISDVLGDSRREHRVTLRPLRIGDLGWVIGRHGAVYAEEFGWDESFEALVARIVADYAQQHDPRRENAWIAEIDGEPVGCVFCVRKDDDTAQLRILLVEPSVRGCGVGTALVDACIEFARQAGYRKVVLWTNSVLESARHIYERAGFKLLDEQPHHSYGHDLISQWWVLEL
jgi:DNA-binding MarR family transcriptional regulator/GNAT superfamily N-acetyltransferase